MARPLKEGMDYFPHDTDAVDDEKIDALRAVHGNDGYAFYFILLERIYRTADAALDVSKPAVLAALIHKIGVTPEKFQEILQTAFDIGCFDQPEYETRRVLTSNGIKRRASEIQKMRERWRKQKGEQEGNPGQESGVFPTENGRDNSGENTEETPESKEKKSKEKQSTSTPPTPPTPDGVEAGTGEADKPDKADKPKEPTLEEISNRYPRYSSEQWTTIRDYWDLIRFTRKTGRVAANIVAREMDYWERFPLEVVMEALDIHIRKYQNKQEDYTRGIMRRLQQERERGDQGGKNYPIRQGPRSAGKYDDLVVRDPADLPGA